MTIDAFRSKPQRSHAVGMSALAKPSVGCRAVEDLQRLIPSRWNSAALTTLHRCTYGMCGFVLHLWPQCRRALGRLRDVLACPFDRTFVLQ
eukprot:CAMPEP_0174842178 /NCGR_PEP_ID=MMETSP1114-20130205/9747_1 /TAXON_ID=312471 /ORGANISM="Neobodo designis, Strain CCAP 1951/1" /LENGTH=90 /DNA_ID=CAMNT_0016076375 /DNA_START=31 /DNA_END=300 /DNA_ORIENTATION=-